MDFPAIKCSISKMILGGHWVFSITLDEVNTKPSRIGTTVPCIDDPEEAARACGQAVERCVRELLSH